ncbi:Hypothetical predicted protein [Octopus vulgaris]|uniref:Uncharacterized protein n=1 Tax=Octopus vulgaris TaxID=6645 RepID=A0AA36AIE7_OCTVU|nr:Hypothetical predicted protein [Octopus vulgaris]
MAAMQTTTTAASSLIVSIILIITLTALNIEAKEHVYDCEMKIPPNVTNILSRLVKLGKKVFHFEVHLSNKTLDDLLNPVPLDYFANARHFTWIPDKPDGLIAYKNFYYDFSAYSLNLLNVYIANPRIDIDINCTKQNIQRRDIIYLIFEELKRFVFIHKLKMGKSGYMCFFINLSQDIKKNNPFSFEAYRRIGINREIVKKYCCELHKNESHVYHPKSICAGNSINLTISVLAKPDNVGDVWFAAMFFVYGVTIVNAIMKQYQSVIFNSVKLTKIFRPNLVQTKYGEEFINANLFKTIVNHHFPLRFEIGKSIVKLFLIVSFFFACNNIISREDLDLSTFTRITLILMTSLIPNLLSIMNTRFVLDITLSDKIVETIKSYEEENESHIF